MNKYDTMMRFSYKLADYKMYYPKPEILPMLYKQTLKSKLFIVKKIGIVGAVKLYLFEKSELNQNHRRNKL